LGIDVLTRYEMSGRKLAMPIPHSGLELIVKVASLRRYCETNTVNAFQSKFRQILPLAIFCALLLTAEFALACPNCKAGMSTSDPHAKSMAAGYYYSILFMLSMPFLIVTSFSGWMYLAVRKAKAERIAKTAASPSHTDDAAVASTQSELAGTTHD